MAFFIIVWIGMAVLCGVIASKQGRDPMVWGVLGLLGGIITLVVLAAKGDA